MSTARPADPGATTPLRGRLTPLELAAGALLIDVCVGLCLLGWFLPLGGVAIAVAVTPVAALAARYRLRSVLAAAVAGMVVATLVIGPGVAVNVAGCAVVGALVGRCYRRGWGRARTVVAAVVVIWPPVAVVTLVAMALLSAARTLALDQITISWNGAARILRRFGADAVAEAGDTAVSWSVSHWWIVVPALLLVLLIVVTVGARMLAEPVLARLDRAVGEDRPPRLDPEAGATPRPVPVSVDGASFRYPNGRLALSDVSVMVRPGELLAIVGANGSGKSTLARLLCGAAPTTGRVDRPGPVGLGRPGGTAFIAQRPEAQVLGVRVADDVRWGLPDLDDPAVAEVLARVGLAGYEERETSTLSGGELQRLAVAAAVARRPGLLVSDESTAMIDPDGRRQLVALLRSLADDGIAVVHITHDSGEADAADRVLRLSDGRVVDALPALAEARTHESGRPRSLWPVIELRGVGHVYAAGSPWAHRALRDVDFAVHAGECVLVAGANGSGKSTLAGVLAGLIEPTEGTATLRGAAVTSQLGSVGLAFQHARLQLLRDTVRSEVCSAADVDDRTADAALRSVGLDPVVHGGRRIDELSGGELRRVALAGLLARRPRVLVLDEPLAGLDAAGRVALVEVLDGIVAGGCAVVVISHDLAALGPLADRLVELDAGRIVATRDVVGGAVG